MSTALGSEIGAERAALLAEILRFDYFHLSPHFPSVRILSIESSGSRPLATIRTEGGATSGQIAHAARDRANVFGPRWSHIVEQSDLSVPDQLIKPSSND